MHTGWDGLLQEQHDYLDRFWAVADIEIVGDAELQQAVRCRRERGASAARFPPRD